MRKINTLKTIFLLCLLWAGMGSVSAQTYVKWKLVDGTNVTLSDGDVVVVVDQTTGLAMSNDKDDKAPDAVAVNLNYDKDRLTGDVPDNVQWTYTAVSGGYKFTTGEKTLYADSKGLKIGSGTDNDNVFDITTIDGVGYLHIAVSDKDYLAGVEESMFSNSWKLLEMKEGKPDDKVKDTRIAFFKKVDDAQKVLTLEFPYDNYEINSFHDLSSHNIKMVEFDPATASDNNLNNEIEYYSSKGSVLYPVKFSNAENDNEDPHGDRLCLVKSGTTKLIARINETKEYDKAVTFCTIRYNNTYEDQFNRKGTKANPLTVAEAISLAKGETVGGTTLEEDRCYFIKGKVNKVNSGMLAMFGDMGLDEIMGDDMDMEERMGDMDDFDMSEMGEMMGGMDMGSMIPGFGNSDGLTYYISDDGTKDNRIKVTNGQGLVKQESGKNAVSFEKLDDLSPGDDVLVYGPLVLSENNNMFASLMGGTGGIGGNGQQSDYEWAPISLDELQTDDVVLLVDKDKKIALNSDVKGTSVTIKKDKIADNVAANTQWTLTKNSDGTVTFKKDDNPLSVTTQMTLTVGQGQRSDFTYNNGVLGIQLTNRIYCITWNEADGGYTANFENKETTDNPIADFTFYKRVQKVEEDKRTVKVGEVNYLHDLKMTLLVQNQHMYENTTKDLNAPDPTDPTKGFFYTLNPEQTVTGDIQPALVKSSDEEIAKWVKIDETIENSDSLFTAVKPGKTKVTVKVKVIVTPAQGDEKEKYYTMKRKFQLEVRPRDKEPEGKNVGEYVLVDDVSELDEGTRLLIVGTRTKDGEETNYITGSNNSMMGGGKSGNKINNDKIAVHKLGKLSILYNDVPENSQEIILEKSEDGDGWYLNVGEDENGDKLYLYASEKEKEESSDDEEGGFNFDELMEMFSPSSGLKVGTKAGTANEAVDSLKATITISNNIATIKFAAAKTNNTIVLCSSFDMDAMTEMFGGLGNKENTEEETEENTSGMNFDFFMASFNTKEKKEDDKNVLPRIFGFIQYDEYPISIGDAEWMTIVSDYDVIPGNGVDAYVVKQVLPGQNESKAVLKKVVELKGGVPYLLHSSKGEYQMTRTSDVEKPETNLLLVSDKETTGTKGNSSVYVLAEKSKGVGFYKWTGGKLGSGRVYLPVDVSLSTAEFCSFFEDPTSIQSIDGSELIVGPCYDLQGRRVEKLTKGVYIVNGKKVVVK